MEPVYLPRLVDESLARALGTFPIVVLDGPRAVGKTTTARQVARTVVRFPQDLPLIAVDAATHLKHLEPPVLVDEWQLAGTDLLWTLKQLVDDDPTPGRFILTGSVEPATYGPTYPLTGRAARLVMYPMTSAEINGAGDAPSFLEQLVADPDPLAHLGASFDGFALDRLVMTGFPAARDQADASMFLQGYAAIVAQRAGDEGRDAARLARALTVLGVLTAQAVPDQRIWQAADINKATWKAYDDLLKRVHLSVPVPAFSSNRLKRLTSYPKQMLVDTALALASAGFGLDHLATEPELRGPFVESFAAQQLRPQIERLGGTLWHVRTSAGGHEIDLVAEIGTRRYGFEVKAASRPTAADTKHLRWLHEELPDIEQSFVVHTGREIYAVGDRITALPITAL